MNQPHTGIDLKPRIETDSEQARKCGFKGAWTNYNRVRPGGCDREATWEALATCCQSVDYYCDEHAAFLQEWLKNPPTLHYSGCGKVTHSSRIWTRL